MKINVRSKRSILAELEDGIICFLNSEVGDPLSHLQVVASGFLLHTNLRVVYTVRTGSPLSGNLGLAGSLFHSGLGRMTTPSRKPRQSPTTSGEREKRFQGPLLEGEKLSETLTPA